MDEHRAPWEPRGFYLFRRLFRASIGIFLVFGFGLGAFLRSGGLWSSDEHWTTAVIVLAVGAGAGVLGIVVASVGMIVTAPKDRKRRDPQSGDEPTGPRWRL